MTVVENAGHEVRLFDTTFMNSDDNKDNSTREQAGLVKPVTLDNYFNKKSTSEIETDWIKALTDFKPDLIATTIVEDAYTYAHRLLSLAKASVNAPVVVGGSMPTVVPRVMIENPNIDYLVEGEGEVAFVELTKALMKDKDVSKVPNLWYQEDGVTKNTGLVKYLDMDEIPFQKLDFWDDKHFTKPYDGQLRNTGFFEASRGCMHKCHYCINRAFQVFQEEAGKVRRNKSPRRIIDEVKHIHKQRNFNLIMFTDDNFLGRQPRELEEFFKLWTKEVKIPYWINTCIETVNENNLPLLKESGCVGIAIGLETGSDWVRRNLLLKGKMDNKFYMEKFALMAKYKIRSTANNMLGIPGEYEEDFFETIKLNKQIRALDPELTSFDVSYMAPYMGTVIHNIALDMNLIEPHIEPGFRGMSKAKITMRHEPTMKNPCMTKEKTMELHDDFMKYVNGEKPIPEKFLKDDPERRFADNDEIYTLYEKYKRGPIPIDPVMVVPVENCFEQPILKST
ncbi:MAG: radical SAM protein [Pseudomonadota bacterium]|nr:radical SAM protein [Pseudomonadota bacterium]